MSSGSKVPASDGGRVLLESQGLEIGRRLGLQVPPHEVLPVAGRESAAPPVDDSGVRAALERVREAAKGVGLSLERVVLKAQVPGLVHKTEAGAMVVANAEPESVLAAWRTLLARPFPAPLESVLLEAFVPHGSGLTDELLLSVRANREFGPVVTLAPGGTLTEFWAENLPAEGGPLFLSPELAGREGILRDLEGRGWGRLLTRGLRGAGGTLSADRLGDFLAEVIQAAGPLIEDGVVEAEFNPVVVGADGSLVALDAVVRVREEPRREEGPGPEGAAAVTEGTGPSRPRDLSPLIEPRSVAIMGVSARGMNPGRIILRNTLGEGFDPNRLWVVKEGETEVDGCPCVPSLEDLPEPVDLLVLAIPAAQVPEVVGQVTRAGLSRSIILIPGGLGEVEGTASRVQGIRRSLREAREQGRPAPLVNGGNCLGVRSGCGRLDTLFIPRYKLRIPEGPTDPVALLSQSGAFAVARMSSLWPLNPELVVTFGNQLDLTVGDYLESLAGDPALRVFAVYVEGFNPGDGARFVRAARTITREGRAVILYRAGRSPAGREASASHTASMAGDYAVTTALARQAGVMVAESLEEFDDLVRLSVALDGREVGGREVMALSNAGFECVALADHSRGLDVAELRSETRDAVEGILEGAGLSGIVSPRNPVDLTPMTGDRDYGEIVSLARTAFPGGVAVVGCVPLTGALQTLPQGEDHSEDLGRPEGIAARLVDQWRTGGNAWVAVIDGGPDYDPLAATLREGGLPVFRTADRAVRALSRYVSWRLER